MSGIPQIYGGQQPTIGGQTDPQSQYLAQALHSMGAQPQGSPAGVGGNLLAQALMMHTLQQRQNQMSGQGLNWMQAPGVDGVSVGVPSDFIPPAG